ncbi:uncharacterized protein LOC120332555 [Styela clava]|uniref:ELKS/Rab6-interacting/CAST family member 1-like n=1 Tax=Styela clava TaxID=7725 RepID=UPI00193A1845|nr:ELKS/Rab6-interacting/CAST family member 1-like [Styela clava]
MPNKKGSENKKKKAVYPPAYSPGKSSTLKEVESEYIKNLQQQIYFLELETTYLRDQAKKATDIQPKLVKEADQMMTQLKERHSETNDLKIEVSRKDASISMLTNEKNRLDQELRAKVTTFDVDRGMLREEIIQLKKLKDVADRDIARKDSEIVNLRQELDRTNSDLRHTQHNLALVQSQLDQRITQHTETALLLEGKREENLRLQSDMHASEERHFQQTATMQEQITRDLQTEIRGLRQQVREKELAFSQERILKDKLLGDVSKLTQENTAVQSQILELSKQLDRERILRGERETRAMSHTSQIAYLKGQDEVKSLESRKLLDMIEIQKQRCRELENQILKMQDNMSHTNFQGETVRSRLTELESRFARVDTENTQLRHDKQLLVEHVANIQRSLDQKESEVQRLQTHVHTLQTDVSRAHTELDMTRSLQSMK